MDNQQAVSWYQVEALKENIEFSFREFISDECVDEFARLSGDVSPLHVSAAYAKKSGFPDRVAHGVLSMAYVSRLIGVHLPGGNSIISGMSIKFKKPVMVNTEILVSGVVKQVAESVGVVVVAFSIQSPDKDVVYVTGEVTVKIRK